MISNISAITTTARPDFLPGDIIRVEGRLAIIERAQGATISYRYLRWYECAWYATKMFLTFRGLK
jgi:hypothetical protein